MKLNSVNLAFSVSVLTIVFAFAPASAASFKCKGADGKIEYSDRPCEGGKESLNKPAPVAGVVPANDGAAITRLEALFKDFEPRLCEREVLANEIDLAQRSGELTASPEKWKSRQEKLSDLNDELITFQEKAAKLTKGTASDSPEMMAVRKFQSKLKNCKVAKK